MTDHRDALRKAREHMAMLANREGLPLVAEAFLRGDGDHREDLKEMVEAAKNGEI